MTVASPPMQSQDAALELHGLLKAIDPARWSPAYDAEVRDRLVALTERMATLLGSLDAQGRFASLRASLQTVYDVMASQLPTPGLPLRDAKRAWKAFRIELTHAYEALSKTLEAWDVHVPSLRPTNYKRNVFHVTWAGLATLTCAVYPQRDVLLPIISGFLGAGVTMEVTRRIWPGVNDAIMRVLGPFAHPHEWHRVNSATWYAAALFLLSWSNAFTASLIALVILGVGDPMAAVIGRRWGRTKLVNGRSLEGTLAFVATGALVSFLVMLWARPEVSVSATALACGVAATFGATAELFSRRVDDNFSIPISAAAGAGLVLSFLGFTP